MHNVSMLVIGGGAAILTGRVWLQATADESGKVLVYDIREECDKPEDSPALAGEFSLHEDVCCNSVAFHPYL